MNSSRKPPIKLTKQIEEMMFGFGDEWPPDPEAVKVVEDLVQRYITELVTKAQNLAMISGRLDKECFLYLVKQETSKFTRINTLLNANDEIKSAQKYDVKEQE